MNLIIAILIVYGITLLIVQGKIFNGIKIKLSNFVQYFENYLYPNEISLAQFINSNSSLIDEKYIKIYKELFPKLQTNDETVLNLFSELQNKIVENIKTNFKKSKWYYPYLVSFKILNFFQSMIQCMMCTGFWVGMIITLWSSFCTIQLFGNNFTILTYTSDSFAFISYLLLLSGLFSGTTWIINIIVSYFEKGE